MFRFTGSALTLLAVLSLFPEGPADAGSREGHRVVKHQVSRLGVRPAQNRDRHRVRVVNKNVVVIKFTGNRHRRVQVDGIYSGILDVSWRAGVGQWSYGTSSAVLPVQVLPPRLKIIDVGSLKANNACAMEAGVCVIRP